MTPREKLLALKQPTLHEVHVAELDATFYVRKLRVGERVAMESCKDERTGFQMLVLGAVCDENGEPMLTPEDMEAFMKQDFGAAEKLIAKVVEVNKVDPVAAKNA